MTIDIRFNESGPKQYQKIRLITVYVKPDMGGAEPEIVFHSKEYSKPMVYIPLKDIHSITFTED